MRRGAGAGFTLLEILLAMTLMSLILASIGSGLHLGRRSWETGLLYESVAEVEEAARAVAAQLAQVFPVSLAREGAAATVAFNGRANACRFVTLSEGGGQWGGLNLMEIGDQAGGRGSEVTVWTRVFRAEEWANAARQSTRAVSLLRDAAYFRLSYFGEVRKGSRPVWSDDWVDRESLPLLIGVRLGARRFGRVVDASFVVAVRQRCGGGFYRCPD